LVRASLPFPPHRRILIAADGDGQRGWRVLSVEFSSADWSVMLTHLSRRNDPRREVIIATVVFVVEAAGLTLNASVQCFGDTRYCPGYILYGARDESRMSLHRFSRRPKEFQKRQAIPGSRRNF